jgi:DNA-binding MarR family transcriptional regulator
MKKADNSKTLKKIRVHPQNLDGNQPLARFMISLFKLFEDEIISKLSKTPFREVTRTDLSSMRYIDENGSTVSQLANFAGVSKQAMSKQVENLSKRGYLKKFTNQEDGRVFKILFTEKGLALINLLVEIIRGVELKYERTIGKSEYIKIKANLKLLISLYNKE